MIAKKALLLVTAVMVLAAAGCISTSEHQRKVSALQQQIEQERGEAEIARRELAEAERKLEQKERELENVKTDTEEFIGLSARLQQAKEERERNLAELESLVRDISGMRVETRTEGDFIIIENEILFDPGQIELKSEARGTISRSVIPYIMDQLGRDSNQMIRIDGHTDGQPIRVSPYDDNHHLSVMRAHSVMKFLVEQNVPRRNIFLAGFGPNRPLAEPPSPEADVAENRRVEILLIPARQDDVQQILDDFLR